MYGELSEKLAEKAFSPALAFEHCWSHKEYPFLQDTLLKAPEGHE